jgi:hypothetical protein
MDPITILVALGPAVATAVVSYGVNKATIKTTLNGTVNRVKAIEDNSREHEKKDSERHEMVIDRLARIETKIDERTGNK